MKFFNRRPLASDDGAVEASNGATDPACAPSEFADSQIHDVSIGEILRRSRKLNADRIPLILHHQREHGLRFGDSAVALGLAERDDVLWALSRQFHYPYTAPAGAEEFHPELVMANDPFSDEVESFRDLRSHLLMSVMAPEEARRALAIVSADVGDGKSFTTANLAVAFSQLPAQTLIIDGDMRSPRLHELFGIDNAHGLSGVLQGRTEPEVIRAVPGLPNLFVLPVGTVPPNPLELLQRNAFTLMLREVCSRFDYVLIDTPAAVQGSDARLIASRSGAALIVARRHKTHTKAVQRLGQHLVKASVVMAGVVMNDA